MAGQNHRAVHRVNFVQAAVLHTNGEAVAARLTAGGECSMTLTLGPDVVLELTGEVVRTEDGGSHLGISWGSMDVDSASHLRRLLELNLGNHELLGQDIEAMYAAHNTRSS